MKEYITVNDYCREIFGGKVYKLALSAARTCPNRDGIKGVGGCIFCSAGGSGDFAADADVPILSQIDMAKSILGRKGEGCRYIAYFQAFTGTYGDISGLREKYEKALECKDIVGLSIATRPDCLSCEAMEMLEGLSKRTRLWVELGLQTVNEAAAKYINRCYGLCDYEMALEKLRGIDAHIITHVILGLPGEEREDMLRTVSYVGDRTDGIKLQLLHILRGTPLANEYEKHSFKLLSLEEYCDILCDCMAVLPDRVVIHRLTGDGPKRDLIAPLWSADKKRVLAAVNRAFADRGIVRKAESEGMSL